MGNSCFWSNNDNSSRRRALLLAIAVFGAIMIIVAEGEHFYWQ